MRMAWLMIAIARTRSRRPALVLRPHFKREESSSVRWKCGKRDAPFSNGGGGKQRHCFPRARHFSQHYWAALRASAGMAARFRLVCYFGYSDDADYSWQTIGGRTNKHELRGVFGVVARGEGVRQLVIGMLVAALAAWSQSGPSTVRIATLDFGVGKLVDAPHVFSPEEGANHDPVWSSDGKLLAYMSVSPGDAKRLLVVRAADSGELRKSCPCSDDCWSVLGHGYTLRII